VRKRFPWVALFALFVFVMACSGADAPVGSVNCTASFKLDGLSVPHNATLFAGNKIQAGNGSCTITITGGKAVVQPQSGVAVGPGEIELSNGIVRITGSVRLRVPYATKTVEPVSADAIINSRLLNGLWTVNVAAGSAKMTDSAGASGPNAVYVHFSAGSRMSFSTDPGNSSALSLRIDGCVSAENGLSLLRNEHVNQKIALVDEATHPDGQHVSVTASLDSLPPDSPDLAARVHVLAEQRVQGTCPAFSAVSNLGEEDARRKVGILIGLGAGAGLVALHEIIPDSGVGTVGVTAASVP
jgi:hypothetical protein